MERNGLWQNEKLEKVRGGDHVPCGDISKEEIPSWLDTHKFDRAKKIYSDYFASVNFSHFCGLLLVFYFTKILKTLNSTGESSSKLSLFHRYLQTIRHVQKWYEGNVFNVNDAAYRSLSIVRSMHTRAAKNMSSLNDGQVYVSQYDMAMTQWAFIAPLVLFRSRIGLHGLNDDDYDALIHFWRTIGFLLGIKDDYNICHGDYSQAVSACKVILEKEYKVRMAAADSGSVTMGKNVINAMNMIDHVYTWNSLSTYIHELVGLPCPDRMGVVDWIFHCIVLFCILVLTRYSITRHLFNNFTKWKLDLADKKDLKLIKTPSITIGG